MENHDNPKIIILGWWEKEIFFRLNEDIVILNRILRKEDLILHLKIDPSDVKHARDAILIDASFKPLTQEQKNELVKEKYEQDDERN